MPKQTNEVAVVEETTTAMTTQEPFDNGLGELEASDLIIPRLSITQPTTPEIEADQVGKFCVNVTGDFQDTLRVALVKLSKSRILFPEKYKRDNDPLCRSHDFIVPANDIDGATPMCDTCALLPGERSKHACEYANWAAGNTPPKCQETWNLLVVDIDTYMPMWFSVKSTALKPLRKIISAVSMISQAKRKPMWGMEFTMNLDKVTNDSGTFYLPSFSGLTILDDDEAENMAAIRAQLVDIDIKDSAEPVESDAPTTKDDEEF